MFPLEISLHEALLSSREILEFYVSAARANLFELQKIVTGVSSRVFVTVRRRTEYRPDYAYKNEQKRVYGHMPTCCDLLDIAVKSTATRYLRFDGKHFSVQRERFEEWQCLLTRVSPLLLMVGGAIVYCKKNSNEDAEALLLNQTKYSTLPMMDHRLLSGALAKRGLAEVHMHLNGTTEADKVWLDALKQPRLFVTSLKEAFKANIEEQLLQNSHFISSPMEWYNLLITASSLRWFLCECIYKNKYLSASQLSTLLDQTLFSSDKEISGVIPSIVHPVQYQNPTYSSEESLQLEGRFLFRALKLLEEGDELVAIMLHSYLLIQSCFSGLLVQQRNQNGFDQFQRIADNKLRDPSEVGYEHRFHQIRSHLPGNTAFIEGRFAPKGTSEKNSHMLKKIKKGWEAHCNRYENDDPKKMVLSLTAHFIKLKDRNTAPLYRHHKLRVVLRNSALRLLLTIQANPELRPYVTSADAAANELHAGPEVFAPVFRLLRSRGWTHFTFHVGEDFHHLASGLRAIWEAVTFLDLSSGDRIGHGTALGISPQLWAERLGETIAISRQEWLDTLLFVYTSLRYDQCYSSVVQRCADLARTEANNIFVDRRPALDHLINAWEMRKLDPFVAFDANIEKQTPISLWKIREYELAQELGGKCSKSLDLFKKYHLDEDVRKRSEELIQVRTNEIPFDVITALQRKIIERLNSRQIALEVMPTSNVRISIYEKYEEHHIFRLLGCDDSEEYPMGVSPAICLASDDPGIFATCLQNEYAHVFNGLLKKGKSEHEALQEIERLIDNAWAYAFRSERS